MRRSLNLEQRYRWYFAAIGTQQNAQCDAGSLCRMEIRHTIPKHD